MSSPFFCLLYGPCKKAEHAPQPASPRLRFHYGHKGDSSLKARIVLCLESGVPLFSFLSPLGRPLALSYSAINMICLPPHWARTSVQLFQLLKNTLTSKHSAIYLILNVSAWCWSVILSLLLSLFFRSFQCVCMYVCVF